MPHRTVSQSLRCFFQVELFKIFSRSSCLVVTLSSQGRGKPPTLSLSFRISGIIAINCILVEIKYECCPAQEYQVLPCHQNQVYTNVALFQKITMLLRFCQIVNCHVFQTDTNISKSEINICRDATKASLPWKAESILSGDLFAVVKINQG